MTEDASPASKRSRSASPASACVKSNGRSRAASLRRCRPIPTWLSSASLSRASTTGPKSPEQSATRSTSRHRACSIAPFCARHMRMPRCAPSTFPRLSATRGARDRARNQTRRPGAGCGPLRGPARRRGRGDLDGGGGGGAPAHSRRLQAAALRRRHGRSAPAKRRQVYDRGLAREAPQANSSPRRGCLSKATCAARPARAAATSLRGWRAPPPSSKANIAHRSRRIAAWSRTALSPIGSPTD